MISIHLARERSMSTSTSERALDMIRRDMARYQEQMTTGLRVNRASDDAPAFVQARRMERLSNRYDQYLRTIGASQSWVDHSQDALDGIADRIAEAKERGIRANNAFFDPADRDSEANRVEAILAEVIDLLNTKDDDEYVFAGTNTTVKPFTGTGAAVVYNGNSDGQARQIGDDQRINVNITGDAIHDTGAGFTVTQSIQELADAIRTGDPAVLETALDRVTVAQEHILDRGAESGGIANRLDFAASQLRDANIHVRAHRSELEDVDMAAAVMEYQKAQTGFEAALRVTANVLQTSLLDYLR